ncbi:MAG: uracil-DNA glycosylase [Candidatus Marinimicrobia bacterium]|nr:uracil-DNA glycosylase [Candidatus Neomarinimicrobiota bacterium]
MQEKIPFIEYMKDVYGKEVYAGERRSPLYAFYEEIKNCNKCALAETRYNLVFGAGDPDADILFVGEAPGQQEDLSGIPFVGRAGKLLDKVLAETEISREDVFIANVLKCRPPQNRDPLPEEIALCEHYLHRQIELIRPKVIVALGRIAANTLLRESNSLKSMRGQTYRYHDTDLRVTYHPAAILRNMNMYDLLKNDLQEVVKRANNV